MAGDAMTDTQRAELEGLAASALRHLDEGHETRAYWALDLIPRLIRAWNRKETHE